MKNDSKSGPHILIIEDDAAINDITASYLKKKNCRCTQAYSGSEARLLLTPLNNSEEPVASQTVQTKAPFDLILTDLMLPGLSGQELIDLVRQTESIPVIVISALDAPGQKVELFDLGADDYLTKPFDLDELYARILVQLRHKEKLAALSAGQNTCDQQESITYKEWCLKPQQRSLEASGAPVDLTRLEYNIIETLMTYPTKVFTKQELFEAAWHEECFIEEKAINVHISNIRSKLRPSGTDSYIQTVWGIGFKLEE